MQLRFAVFPAFLLFATASLNAQFPVPAILAANNVKAVVKTNGYLFNNLSKGQYMYPMQMEVQCQVFAFDCIEENPLRNAVFVRYKLINRALESITDLYWARIGIANQPEQMHKVVIVR